MKTKKLILFFVAVLVIFQSAFAIDFSFIETSEFENSLISLSDNIFEAIDLLYLDWIVILIGFFIIFYWAYKKIIEYANERFDIFEEEKSKKITMLTTSATTLIFFIINAILGLDAIYNALGIFAIAIALILIPVIVKTIKNQGYNRTAYFSAIVCYALLVPKVYQPATLFVYWTAIIMCIIVAFMPKKIFHNKKPEADEKRKDIIIERQMKRESHLDRHLKRVEKDMLRREKKELKEVNKELREDQRQKKILKNIVESAMKLGKLYYYKKNMHLQATEPKTKESLEKIEQKLSEKINSEIDDFKISLAHEMKDLGFEMHELKIESKESSKEVSELHKQEKIETRLSGLMKNLSDKKTQLSYHKEIYENIENITKLLKENEKKEAELIKQGLKLVKMISVYISEVRDKIEKQEITGEGNALFYCQKILLLIEEKIHLNKESRELILESEELTKKILRKIKEKEKEDELELNESKLKKRI